MTVILIEVTMIYQMRIHGGVLHTIMKIPRYFATGITDFHRN